MHTKKQHYIYQRYVKRAFDVILSLLALLLFWWVFAIVALMIRIKLGSPVLFKQERIGKDEKPFMMCKFRSMSDVKDSSGNLLSDTERISTFGSFLRSSSLDEIPAVVCNILPGDMSFIGPRPLPTLYLPYYTDAERVRHNVRGGISGLAQVNGRNALSWEEKFAFDITYVKNASFLLDLSIFFKTITKVFKRADIGLRGVSGPPDFNLYRGKADESYCKHNAIISK